MEDEIYKRGLEKMKQVDGEDGERVLEILKTIAPDFADYIVKYPFGEIYSRAGLDWKSREIGSVAALAAMGNAKPQLKTHIRSALSAGCSQKEIVELMMHVSVFAGFPAALNGLFAAKEVFDKQ